MMSASGNTRGGSPTICVSGTRTIQSWCPMGGLQIQQRGAVVRQCEFTGVAARTQWLVAATLGIVLSSGCADLFGWFDDSDENACQKECEGRCGPSGECDCGGCDAGQGCHNGSCTACEVLCVKNSCGNISGCDCGECAEDLVCYYHLCRSCEEVCGGKECGDRYSCNCGSCPENHTCHPVDAVCKCNPTCEFPDGKPYQCGSNGCDGQCGTSCSYGNCIDHKCVCQPACAEPETGAPYDCGPDGCGSTCGVCSSDDWCVEHLCAAPCDLSGAAFSQYATKAYHLSLGAGGVPGEALDVDSNPETCAPQQGCEAGLDNGLSLFFGQLSQFLDINTEFAQWLDGDLFLILELLEPVDDGNPFVMRLYHGQKAFADGECYHQSQKCNYYMSVDSFDPFTCEPYNSFDNAVIDNGRLKAGGPDCSVKLLFHSASGMWVETTVHNVTLEADVFQEQTDVGLLNGVIGGVVGKQALADALYHLLGEQVGGIGVSSAFFSSWLQQFLIPDFDLDSDGTAESLSFGIKFESLPANIEGVSTDTDWGVDP